MLHMQNVGVQIGHTPLLTDVSLAVSAGQVVAVVGPNGAGKSTLLRAMGGEILPSRGQVVLEGQPLPTWPRRQRAQVMAVLPQESTLTFPFTVFEVVMMGRTPPRRWH